MTQPHPSTAPLTLDAAREALELHVRTTRWLRRDLAKKLNITSFERSGSFHVVFRSFTETRRQAPTFVPHFGGLVDGPENGKAPAIWDISVKVPGNFINEDHAETIPHTEVVRGCHVCHGVGRVTCHVCSGDGKVTCSTCGGDGREDKTRTRTRTNAQGQEETYSETYTETCSLCLGAGRLTCATCNGSGRVTCSTCNGTGRLKHFEQLHVAWRTRVNDNIIEKTDLPDDLISGAIGIVIHAEEDDRLETSAAGSGGPYRGGGRVNTEVNEVANRLIVSHQFRGGEKLHRQSLVVRSVPVYEAHYTWGKATRRFWVYGTDEQIYAPKYPLSLIRVGVAIGVPTAIVGAGATIGLVGASTPPPRPPVVMTVTSPTPLPTPPPIPTVAPTPLPPPQMLTATAKAPIAPPGNRVIEIRSDPPGAEVIVSGKKVIGKTPLFTTIPSRSIGVCTFGKCNVGECVSGKTCEPVLSAKLRNAEGKTLDISLKPSLGPVFEFRF